MKNLTQMRALSACNSINEVKAKSDEGNQLSGYGSLIINSGLISTLLFSLDKGGQLERISTSLMQHLSQFKYIKLKNLDNRDLKSFVFSLIRSGDNTLLRFCTEEAIEYISILRRLAK